MSSYLSNFHKSDWLTLLSRLSLNSSTAWRFRAAMNSPSKDVQEFAALLRTLAAESKQLVAAGIADLDPAAVSSSNSIEAESFLTLQSALMLSYTHHLLALSSHRMLGLSLSKDARGRELVSNLVRMRLQLENMRPIEARLKPKWERWIRASQAAEERRTNRGNQKARDDVIGDEDNEDDADDIGEYPILLKSRRLESDLILTASFTSLLPHL